MTSEDVARIIDPKPWAWVDRGVKIHETVLADSLAKADAILALLPEQGVEAERDEARCDLDLDALEKVALGATQGHWSAWRPTVEQKWWVLADLPNTPTVASRVTTSDAAHITTFDPPTVLKLIAAARLNASNTTDTPAFSVAGDGERGAGWRPTHRHLKRGTTYAVVGEGLLQTAVSPGAWDDLPVTVYRGEDGRWWVRPTYEFNDGRFEALAKSEGGAS